MTSENFRTNPMFLRNQFKGDGIFDIPLLKTDEIDLEEIELIGYDKLCDNKTEAIVHFFMDDYKFEVMWKDPEPRIERMKEYRAVLPPDFSMYTEMPLSIKVYNTFRSRWCGAYMQDKGIKVIPTVSWGEPNTFWFCFDGIPKGSVVAVSTIGVRKEISLFMQGYEEMMRKIKLQAVICYGEPFEEMKGKIIKVDYAQTNNYKKYYTLQTEPRLTPETNMFDMHIKRAFGYVSTEKGRGSAGGGNISLPKNDSQLKHIFRKKQGHIDDTPSNRTMLERVANNKENFVGTDSRGIQWYSQIQPDGSQVWVSVRNETIQNGGINSVPKPWNPQTGFNNMKGITFNMTQNYTDKAYLALYKIIDKYYDEDKNDWIASLASDMCPYTFVDSKSADPATYEDFTDCFNLCFAQSQKEDIETAYAASIKFLEMYRDEFGFDIGEYIEKLSFETYSQEFEKVHL